MPSKAAAVRKMPHDDAVLDNGIVLTVYLMGFFWHCSASKTGHDTAVFTC
jgi:hypothetical protein